MSDVNDVVTAVAWAVSIEGGREHIGVFTRLGEEELLDVVDEGISVVAEGDWTEGGWISGGVFWVWV